MWAHFWSLGELRTSKSEPQDDENEPPGVQNEHLGSTWDIFWSLGEHLGAFLGLCGAKTPKKGAGIPSFRRGFCIICGVIFVTVSLKHRRKNRRRVRKRQKATSGSKKSTFGIAKVDFWSLGDLENDENNLGKRGWA